MYHIKKNFKFEAAHRLLNMSADHPCSNLHGHSYKVTVEVECEDLDPRGMVIDFSTLGGFQMWLNDRVDHATILSSDDPDLNVFEKFCGKTFIMEGNTTAENMAKLFAEKIENTLTNRLNLNVGSIEVCVQETENNTAGYTILK